MPSMGILPLDGAPQGHPGCALEGWKVQVCGWPPAASALGFGEPDSLKVLEGGKGLRLCRGGRLGTAREWGERVGHRDKEPGDPVRFLLAA